VPKGRSRRRSARVQLNIPVTIALPDSDQPLSAETVTVSKHGAKVRIGGHARSLKRGDSLCITISDRNRSRVAKIVWIDDRGNGHCGIEFGEPGNFWGLHFPGSGEKNAVQEEEAAQESLKSFEAVRASRTQSSPPPLPVRPRIPTPPLADIAARFELPTINTDDGTQAVITGLSAVRSSFSERIMLNHLEDNQATVLLTRVIEPGVTLRIMTGDDRVLTAKVMAVSDRREGDKWRVWLKLLSSKPAH